MNRTSSVVKINGDALRTWLIANKLTQKGISRNIGYKKSYISNAIYSNRISKAGLEVLRLKFGLDPNLIVPPKPTSKPASDYCIKGYTVALDVRPDKVCFELLFNDEKIVRAWSKIKSNSELDFIQAVSDAAYMCYRLMEQTGMEENNA